MLSTLPPPSSPTAPAATAFPRRVLLAFLLLVFTIVPVMVTHRFDCDDAYIFVRYAQNLVAGHGPVYNPGERVEGFTSPLWLFVFAVGTALKLPPMVWAGVIGMLLTVGLLVVLFTASRLWGQRTSAVDLIAPLIAGTHLGVLSYAASGMCTSLYVFLVTATAVQLGHEISQPTARPWSALLAGAAALARPEGLVVAAVCGTLHGWYRRSPRSWLWWVLAFGPSAAYLAWRLAYYGYPLPNTYYARALPLRLTLWLGSDYVFKAVQDMRLWPIVPVLAAIWMWNLLPLPVRPLLPLSSTLALIPLNMPHDWMPYYRFFLPAVPLLALLLQEVTRTVQQRFPRGTVWRGLVILALAIASLQAVRLGLPSTLEDLAGHRHGVARWRAVGRWVAQRLTPDDVVVLEPAGVMGLEIKGRIVEMYGTTDAVIAHTRADTATLLTRLIPGHNRSNADYVLSLRPAFIIPSTFSTHPISTLDEFRDQFWSRALRDLLARPELERDYVPVNVPYPPDNGYVVILERRDHQRP